MNVNKSKNINILNNMSLNFFFVKSIGVGSNGPPSLIYCNISFGVKWPTNSAKITCVTFLSSVSCLPTLYLWNRVKITEN